MGFAPYLTSILFFNTLKSLLTLHPSYNVKYIFVQWFIYAGGKFCIIKEPAHSSLLPAASLNCDGA